ncbi:MAG: hypothetical protein IJU29_08445 [Oscillospiraceae bacterium]|nr:hypothetical protein [Oscillospiraceae bacterium]
MGMWVANYYKTLAWFAFCKGSAISVQCTDGTYATLTVGSNLYDCGLYDFAPGYNHNNNAGSYSSIVFGTGDTAVTYYDYALKSKWTSNISRITTSSTGPTLDSQTGVLTETMTATVQNNGSAAVTVREWGIEGYANYSGKRFLLYRDLLQTPVTLNQYEAATFTCTLLYQIPNWTASGA